MTKNKNVPLILIGVLYVGFVAWWASFQSVVDEQGLSTQWFLGTYGLMALVGALIGFLASHKWGGFKSVLGKSLAFFSLGLLAQEAGQLMYQYYIYVEKIDIPYPSLGDVGYFGSVLLYIVAALYLTKIAGAGFSLRHSTYKFIAIAVPLILVGTSYWILLHNHEYDTSHPLTVFLDLGYPIGQAIYISIAITAYILSRKLLGGIMKSGIILVILALCIQYLSDFTFVYQSNRGTFVPGKIDDLFYLTAYFVMTIAMLKFLTTYRKLHASVKQPVEISEAKN